VLYELYENTQCRTNLLNPGSSLRLLAIFGKDQTKKVKWARTLRVFDFGVSSKWLDPARRDLRSLC
jgi:hypothetical protein